MGSVDVYLWSAGPLTLSEAFIHLVAHLAAAGTLTPLFVESAHRYGAPFVAAVPGALLVVCVLLARRLVHGVSSSGRPSEPLQPYGTGRGHQVAIDVPSPVALDEAEHAR
jgi:hypothetical protein